MNILQDSDDAGTDVDINDLGVGWYDEDGVFVEAWMPDTLLPTTADAIQFDAKLGGSLFSAKGLIFHSILISQVWLWILTAVSV